MQKIEPGREPRHPGIDLFRGLLVLAVVLGHFSELTRRESFLTWLGAGVRMPLFIGLTGYLFNLERARAMRLPALLHRYYPRLILPWLVACTIHLTLTDRLVYHSPVSIFVHPPFHLWFVPVMMAFIVVATVSRRAPAAMLAIALPVSVVAMYLFGVGHVNAEAPDWLPDRRFFIYPIYFFYGLWIARRPPDPWRYRAALILAPIGFLWWCGLYDAPKLSAEVAAELTSCLPLIYLLPRVQRVTTSVPVIDGIGRDSLFFYLWHPMAFGVLRSCGVEGLTMLLLAMPILLVARALFVRLPGFPTVFGIQARRGPAGASDLPVLPVLATTREPAL